MEHSGCLSIPARSNRYTLVRCGACPLIICLMSLDSGFEPFFTCACGHDAHTIIIYEEGEEIPPPTGTENCKSCIATHVYPTLCCWSCGFRERLSDRVYNLETGPCKRCDYPCDSSSLVKWEVVWCRPVLGRVPGYSDLHSENKYEDGGNEDGENKYEAYMKVFEIGVMDEEPAGDIESFRKKAYSTYRWDTPISDRKFLNWVDDRADEGWEGAMDHIDPWR